MSDCPTALVTGGSRGIGRGIVLALARAGFSVAINYRSNLGAAEETVALALGQSSNSKAQFKACQADISVSEDRERMLASIRASFGRLDVLVNNAGVAPEIRADLLDLSEVSLDRLLAVNLKGPFLLTQQVSRWMLEQRGAHSEMSSTMKIITVSSISAYTASVNRGDYCLSKAGLSMLTPLFASRLADAGIQVFELRPGIIHTDMTAAVREKYDTLIAEGLTPIKRWGTPEDIARAVVAIVTDAFPFSTGEVFNLDGGFHLKRL